MSRRPGSNGVGVTAAVPVLHGSYGRFAAMIVTSMAIMFVLKYSLVYQLDRRNCPSEFTLLTLRPTSASHVPTAA